MDGEVSTRVTRLLAGLNAGDPNAAADLLPVVYDDLRALAARYFDHERPDHTLQPTALVHEAFMRLVDQTDLRWESRAHFYRIAATAMRHILVNHARDHHRLKRGGDKLKLSLDEVESVARTASPDLTALDEALGELVRVDERKVQIVELRYFAGFTIEEAARILDISPAQVKRDWTFAKSWLLRRLRRGEAHES